MNDKLDIIEQFFKYDLEIKNILYECAPKEQYRYSKESIIEYSDLLEKSLRDFEYYFDKISNVFQYSEETKKYLKAMLLVYKEELIKCGIDYDKLKNFYNTNLANMREELVNKVGENCVGYTLFSGVSIKEAKSINELLHIIHSNLTNNENIYGNLPVLESKKVGEEDITLYGKNNNVIVKKIFDSINKELGVGKTDILSLNNKIIMMIRDKGHALTIEIEEEKNKYYVRYFIPKICNFQMVNMLKGVKQVSTDSKYAVGVFETSEDKITLDISNLIKGVPTDFDMFKEGGLFYKEEDNKHL